MRPIVNSHHSSVILYLDVDSPLVDQVFDQLVCDSTLDDYFERY